MKLEEHGTEKEEKKLYRDTKQQQGIGGGGGESKSKIHATALS